MCINPVELAKELVKIPSITPDSGKCLDYLQGVLDEMGATTRRLPFSDDDTPDVDNLYATIGNGNKHIVFAGHVDVVPVGNESDWDNPPFLATENDGVIYGRGICDMKGAIASFVSALSQLKNDNVKVSLLITGDEEGVAINGTKKMLKQLSDEGEKWDYCITGEPTNVDSLSDAIKIGRRGSFSGTLIVKGKQGHVGYPHLAVNALHHLNVALTGLQRLYLDDGNEYFDSSTLQVVDISTPIPAINLIPGVATGVFNIRFSSEFTGQTLEFHIREFLDKVLDEVEYDLAVRVSAESFITNPNDSDLAKKLSQSVESITGKKPEYSTTGGTSDSRFIQAYCPVVDYGLTGKTIHAVNECSPVAEIEQLAEIYQYFLENL